MLNQQRSSQYIAQERIDSFTRKFGEAHLILACHAVFPLSLSPDLLYQIWANFVPYAPWTAVSDILLSHLFTEVGFELYETENNVRKILLTKLERNPRYGKARLKSLAEFLMGYAKYQLDSPDLDVRQLARSQSLRSLAYLAPSQAAKEIASYFSNIAQEDAEHIQMLGVVQTLDEPLAQQLPFIYRAAYNAIRNPANQKKLKVLICHAFEDRPIIQRLHDRLIFDGFDPWLDSEVVFPGIDWALEIQKALRASDAVIVCLSKISLKKEKYIERELRLSLDIQDRKPRGTRFMIPVQLEKFDIPSSLQTVQWESYFEYHGYERIIKSLNARAISLGRLILDNTEKPLLSYRSDAHVLPPKNAFFTKRELGMKQIPRVGIITALPKEYAAVKAILTNSRCPVPEHRELF